MNNNMMIVVGGWLLNEDVFRERIFDANSTQILQMLPQILKSIDDSYMINQIEDPSNPLCGWTIDSISIRKMRDFPGKEQIEIEENHGRDIVTPGDCCTYEGTSPNIIEQEGIVQEIIYDKTGNEKMAIINFEDCQRVIDLEKIVPREVIYE